MENKEHKEHEEASGGSGDPAMNPGAAPHMGAAPADAGSMAPAGSGMNPDHPDQAQDVALFKQLIAQYLGPDHQDNDEAMKMCQSAYHEALSSGMPHDEAMKCAGYGLKMASLLGQKEHREAMAKEAVGGSEPIPPVAKGDGQAVGSVPGVAGLAQGSISSTHPEAMKQGMPSPMGASPAGGLPPAMKAQSHDASSDGKEPSKEAHKETSVIRLTAENAQLKEANRKLQMEMHLNKLLETSGMPVKTTKAFRNIVAGMKTPMQVEAAWKEFKEAFSESGRASSAPFVFGIEKQSWEPAAEGSEFAFGDCISKTRI